VKRCRVNRRFSTGSEFPNLFQLSFLLLSPSLPPKRYGVCRTFSFRHTPPIFPPSPPFAHTHGRFEEFFSPPQPPPISSPSKLLPHLDRDQLPAPAFNIHCVYGKTGFVRTPWRTLAGAMERLSPLLSFPVNLFSSSRFFRDSCLNPTNWTFSW